jgi:hypothetical protein
VHGNTSGDNTLVPEARLQEVLGKYSKKYLPAYLRTVEWDTVFPLSPAIGHRTDRFTG